MKKKNINDYLNLGEKKNIEFLDLYSNFPKDTSTKTKAKCLKCNHIWGARYGDVSVGHGCPRCAEHNKKLSKKNYIELGKKKNIKFLDLDNNFPKNTTTKTKAECLKCNYIWKPRYDYILHSNRSGCPNCSKNAPKIKKDYIKLGKEKNIEFLELEHKFPKNIMTKTKIKCLKCNYIWEARYDHILHSKLTGCPNCSNKCKKTKENYIKLGKKKNIKFLDLDNNFPKNTHVNTTIKCLNCGNKYKHNYHNLLLIENNGCNICFPQYMGEKITRFILSKTYNIKFPKTRSEIFLFNNKTGRFLELDGFNNEYKLAFEYQGYQHYVFPNYFHKTENEFKAQQIRDKIKQIKCKENNVSIFYIKEFKNFTIDGIFNSIKEAINNVIINNKEVAKLIENTDYEIIKLAIEKAIKIYFFSKKPNNPVILKNINKK